MDISLISKNQKTSLENALKEIYYIAVVEEEHDDDSILLQDIIALVEETLECQKKNFENLSGISPFLGSKYDLVKAFLIKYQEIIMKAENFAYSINVRFGYFNDLASIVAPYILYRTGITDENISFYIGLSLVVANIICDSLANKKEEKKDAIEEKNIKIICQELEKQLVIAKNYAKDEEIEIINKSIEEINKIITDK